MKTFDYFVETKTWESETFKNCHYMLEENSTGYHVRKIKRKEDQDNYTEADVIYSKHYCRAKHDLMDVIKIYRIITEEEHYFESVVE